VGAGGAVDLTIYADACEGQVGGRQVLDAQLAVVVRRPNLAFEGDRAVDRRSQLVDGANSRFDAVGRRRAAGDADCGVNSRVAGRHREVGAVSTADVETVGSAGDGEAVRLKRCFQGCRLTVGGVGEVIGLRVR